MALKLSDSNGLDVFANDSDGALVFLDWLGRFCESDAFDELSPAEQRIMWDLEASIEKSVGSSFDVDYNQLVADASGRIVAGSSEAE